MKDSIKNLLTNRVTRYVTLGFCFRYMSYATNNYFLPAFMLRTYPQYAAQYAVFMATIFMFTGLFSCIFGGILSDRLGQKSNANFGKICYISSMLAGPIIMTATLVSGSFKLSLLCILLKELVGECFSSSGMTMI